MFLDPNAKLPEKAAGTVPRGLAQSLGANYPAWCPGFKGKSSWRPDQFGAVAKSLFGKDFRHSRKMKPREWYSPAV
jgi:hypothetical protein